MGNKMATDTVEELAINVLESALLATGRISSDIPRKDTKLSWDGALYVYKSKESHEKENFLGRIPIQVKGKTKPKIENGRLKHSTSLIDLEIYKNDGGCIYFVVDLSPQQPLIYYDLLLPYDLEKILSEMETKKTTTRLLEQFPSNEDAILRLMCLFISDRDKQFSTAKSTFDLQNPDEEAKKLLSELLKKGIQPLSISCLGTLENPFESCFDAPTYIYVNSFSEIKIPVGRIPRIDSISMPASCSVSVNEIQYYESVHLAMEKNKKTWTIGKSTTIEHPDLESVLIEDCKVRFLEKGTLTERIHDYEFWLALCSTDQNRLVCKNNRNDKIIFEAQGSTNDDIILHKNRLNDLKRIKESLDFFGVCDDLEMDAFSEEDQNHLNILMLASRGKELTLPIKNYSPLSNIKISNLHIFIYIRKSEDGKYKIQNFFDVSVPGCELCNDNECCEASPYLIMKKKDFLKCSNIDYNVMCNSIASKPFVQFYSENLIVFLLETICSYDEKKSDNLIKFVDKLSALLLEKDKNNADLHELNRLQVLKRQRNLAKEEHENLRAIARRNENTIFEIGACILLESFSEARTLWDSLTVQEIENVKAYPCFPILNLWTHHKPEL